MKKLCIVVLCSLSVIGGAKAQFVSQYSQYMFAKGSFNPAAIAEGDMMRLTGLYRQQWVGMPGAPADAYFNLTMPFTYKKQQFGVGLVFNDEKLGLFTKQYVAFQGAYKCKLGDGILSVGANFGAISIGFRGDSAYIPTSDDYHVAAGADGQIPTSQVSGMAFDLSVGAYYTTSSWYAGISVMDVNQPTIRWTDTQETYVGGMMYLTGGYILPVTDTYFTLKPSILLKTNFANYQTDLDLLAEYKEKFWGGLAWRLKESMIFLGGIRLKSGLTIGYSFDLPLSKLISTTYGSHEIVVTYDFSILLDKKKNRYKSVRIL